MNKIYKQKLNIFLLLAVFLIHAGRINAEVTPAWSLKFNSPVLWQKLTILGTLVVGTQNSLYGVDTEKGTIIWELPGISNMSADKFEELPNSFFSQIVNDKEVIILDPTTGKIICNTKTAGFTSVVSKNILFESGGILVYGMKGDNKATLSVFDIATGKELWSKNDIFDKMMAWGAALSASMNTSGAPAALQLIEASNTQVIVSTSGGIYNINTKTGELTWKAELPKPKGAVSPATDTKLFKSPVEPMFYFAKANYMMAYNLADGKQAWASVVKINGIVDEIIYLKEGLVLCPKIDPNNTMFKPKMTLVDYKTGVTSWGKNGAGLALDGSVKNYMFTDAGIVLSMEKENKSYLNILDIKAGTLKFEKSLMFKGVLEYSELTPKGLLYVSGGNATTNGELNIFDLSTGKPAFSKPIESGKPLDDSSYKPGKFSLLRAMKDNKLYVFSGKDKILYEVDKSAGTYKALTAKIEMLGGENPTSIEIRSNGIALMSEQNIAMIDFTGKVKFSSYYEAPTESAFKKALLIACSISAGIDAARYGMASAVYQDAATKTSDAASQALFDGIGKGCGAVSEANMAYSKKAMEAARARFKASAQSRDFMFMMVSLEKEKSLQKRKCGLARIKKDTGEKVEVINLNDDKDPSYDVDEIASRIYYRVNPSEIVCYRF